MAPGSPRPSSDAHHYERKGYGELVWLLPPSSVEDPSGGFLVESYFCNPRGNHVPLWQSLPMNSSLGTICCWMNALSPDQQPSLAPRCSSKPQPDSSPLPNLLGTVFLAATPSDWPSPIHRRHAPSSPCPGLRPPQVSALPFKAPICRPLKSFPTLPQCERNTVSWLL